MAIENIHFYNHEIVDKAPHNYCELHISPDRILQSWSQSLNCYDFLSKNGSVKPEKEMTPEVLQKYLSTSESIKRGEKVTKPVIGIGITDTIEIGIGREIVAVASVLKTGLIPVHVRRAQEMEVRKLLKL